MNRMKIGNSVEVRRDVKTRGRGMAIAWESGTIRAIKVGEKPCVACSTKFKVERLDPRETLWFSADYVRPI